MTCRNRRRLPQILRVIFPVCEILENPLLRFCRSVHVARPQSPTPILMTSRRLRRPDPAFKELNMTTKTKARPKVRVTEADFEKLAAIGRASRAPMPGATLLGSPQGLFAKRRLEEQIVTLRARRT